MSWPVAGAVPKCFRIRGLRGRGSQGDGGLGSQTGLKTPEDALKLASKRLKMDVTETFTRG